MQAAKPYLRLRFGRWGRERGGREGGDQGLSGDFKGGTELGRKEGGREVWNSIQDKIWSIERDNSCKHFI